MVLFLKVPFPLEKQRRFLKPRQWRRGVCVHACAKNPTSYTDKASKAWDLSFHESPWELGHHAAEALWLKEVAALLSPPPFGSLVQPGTPVPMGLPLLVGPRIGILGWTSCPAWRGRDENAHSCPSVRNISSHSVYVLVPLGQNWGLEGFGWDPPSPIIPPSSFM